MVNQIPVGLKHMLSLVRLTCRDGRERSAAVRHIAKMERIDPQSVMSACTRSIGINTSQLDQFFKRDSAKEFCLHLVQRYPGYCDYIESFFDEAAGVARDEDGAAT